MIKNVDTDRLYIYSAEHLMVSAENKTNLTEIFKQLSKSGYEVWKPFPLSHLLYLSPKGHTPEAIMETLADSAYLLAGSDGIVELDGIIQAMGCDDNIPPNDPFYKDKDKGDYHKSINSEDAWRITTGNDSVVVAVLDSGLDKDLKRKDNNDSKDFETDMSEFKDRIDKDGYDFVNNDSVPADGNGHGTLVTSILAGNANNDKKGAGIDWNCKIMPIKILDNSLLGSTSNLIAGIDHARNHGAHVIKPFCSGN